MLQIFCYKTKDQTFVDNCVLSHNLLYQQFPHFLIFCNELLSIVVLKYKLEDVSEKMGDLYKNGWLASMKMYIYIYSNTYI